MGVTPPRHRRHAPGACAVWCDPVGAGAGVAHEDGLLQPGADGAGVAPAGCADNQNANCTRASKISGSSDTPAWSVRSHT